MKDQVKKQLIFLNPAGCAALLGESSAALILAPEAHISCVYVWIYDACILYMGST